MKLDYSKMSLDQLIDAKAAIKDRMAKDRAELDELEEICRPIETKAQAMRHLNATMDKAVAGMSPEQRAAIGKN